MELVTEKMLKDTYEMANLLSQALRFKLISFKIEESKTATNRDFTWTCVVGKEKDAISSTVHATFDSPWKEIEAVIFRSFMFNMCVLDRPEANSIVHALTCHKLAPDNPLAAALLAEAIYTMSTKNPPAQPKAVLRSVVDLIEPDVLPILGQVYTEAMQSYNAKRN